MNKRKQYVKMVYELNEAQYLEYGYNFCENCGAIGGVEGSHRIPRTRCIGKNDYLFYDKINVDLFGNSFTCECHDNMPNGKKSHLFPSLKLYGEIMEFYRLHDKEYFEKLKIKYGYVKTV